MARSKTEEEITNASQGDIETARIPEDAIIIVPEKECSAGLGKLRAIFSEIFPSPDLVSVIPILQSGLRLGQEITEPLGIEMNLMQMSYYRKDTSRLPKPICLIHPDITKIITPEGMTMPVAFMECVVDSQETILAAMEEINATIDALSVKTNRKLAHPTYSTFAYVTKTGDSAVQIPNLVAAFKVDPDVWIGGRGCDLPGDSARELNSIVGILSPFASSIPPHPYCVPLLK